ncbi:oxygen-independent coproporphyrinogen III oxidase [Bartonella sp. HY761]|uniref:oxygen-independent coproporphyrinogen III oxidase n=1 Tax=Bartonella sp. HY761 TaxID=2979330 RepID=UPI002205AA3F|nr:oxygen-independent coproporphyrinogen III oxidase [Bartonella sp. HY761]UXN07792.1 oxygen-independent coproporphyrinogen III oxidase [Bartonella sp. HY761]
MNKETLLHYAIQAVPRYTSYPTAADFVAVGDSERKQWLGEIANGEAVSVYIHVPYCTELCHYCGCFTKAIRRENIIQDYADTLVKDIHLQAGYLKGRPKLVHLHWGGGTPSILSAASFKKVMAALRQVFDFDKDAEHAIELDPRTVTPQLASLMASIGVNRASLGVQDINPDVQKLIGRIQPVEDVENAVKNLRNVGIMRINFDLIYGLPLQTKASLEETCRVVGALEPNRIACYGYAHLPKRRANQRLIDAATLPGAFERFEQAEVVANTLDSLGYVAIGIDHYAKPDDPMTIAMMEDRLHRNFQGYTDDNCPTLIGFGVSSISEFHNGYAQTIADIGQYRRAIDEGTMATKRGIGLDDEDRLRANLIREIMCRFKIDLADYGGIEHFQREINNMASLVKDNIVTIDGSIISITEEGLPFVRTLAALFDTYRSYGQGQFSAAV